MTARRAVALVSLAAFAAAVAAPARGDVILYRKAVPSTVLFHFETDGGTSVGSGVLVDVGKKLVVTAAHVVEDVIRGGRFDVKVAFPLKGKDGRYVTDAVYYAKHPEGRVPGKVVYLNRGKDLALVRLDHLPAGVVAVPLATENPDPGEPVHVIGNSNYFEGGTFGYSEGKVRNVHHHDKDGRVFYSVTHHAPSNRGDSGGAVLSADGKLLAIISQGTVGEGKRQVVDNSVHFSEIRRALEGLQQPGGRRFVVQGSVDTSGWDEFYFPVTKGAPVSLDLKGDGTTDLDLYADDVDGPARDTRTFGKSKKSFGKVLVEENGDSDQERKGFAAGWSGYARAAVLNVGNKKGTNEYTLTVDRFGLRNEGDRLAIPLTVIRRIAASGADAYQFQYTKDGGKARVSIRGDGDTDLEVAVVSPDGAVLTRTKCKEDRVDLTWTPAVDGLYRVTVRNTGKIWNRYCLTTD
ncbi:MAG TPA: trypsin-like peptidase domain-containing protein [Urbifossiella sp.]|nr:trypsin-like peptidase domain-containing protein [Urbifossiella sp.]